MLHRRLSIAPSDRFEKDGSITHGSAFVGEDCIVRWFTHDQIATMEGVGKYSGAWGYNAYDDGVTLDPLPASDVLQPLRR